MIGILLIIPEFVHTMKKVLFVATVFRFFNFEKSDMQILSDMGYEIHTASNMIDYIDHRDDGTLQGLQIEKHQVAFGRSPLSKKSITAYRQLKKILSEYHFDIIHCHTPVASAILRLAAIKTRKKGTKIIYTDHGFHFHKKSSIASWLLYFPVEYFMSFFTDLIITINKEDLRLIKKFPVKQVRYIPGVGVDTDFIAKQDVDSSLIRKQFNVPEKSFLIVSIGELSTRKNHEVIIRAIAEIKESNLYYLIFGVGDKKDYLADLCIRLGIQERVIFAGNYPHNEICKYIHAADIGAIPSLIEGLGLVGIETLAAGKPLVGSNVHGINDYLINNITGVSCNPKDVKGFKDAINKLRTDKDFYAECCKAALLKAKEFDINIVRDLMKHYYNECL